MASDLFKKAITKSDRELRFRCTIDNKVYEGSDIVDCSIEESILVGENFKLGSATASSFDMTLINLDDSLTARSFEGKEVFVEIGAILEKFSRPIEYVSLGYFIIEKASKEKTTIKLSGYDRMIFFEKPFESDLEFPATLLQVAQEVCSLADIQLENENFLNHDYVVQYTPDFNEITLRNILEYISELACGFACINRKGKLEIILLRDTETTIDRSNYYSMNLSEFEYGNINHLVINNEGIIDEIKEGSNTIEIVDNLFALNPTQLLMNNIYNQIKGFTFKPFSCTWQGNVLISPGNVINVSYKEGEVYKSFIARQKFIYGNGLKCEVTTNAKTALQNEFQTKRLVTSSLTKAKAEIKNLGHEILLRVSKEEYETYIQLLEDSIIAKAEDESGNVIMSLKPEGIQIGFNEINDRVVITPETFIVKDANGQVTIENGEVRASRLVASDGTERVVISSDGSIRFDTILYGMANDGSLQLMLFPQAGMGKFKVVQAYGDNNTYSSPSESVLALGKVDEVKANYVQAENQDTTAILSLGHLIVLGNKNCVERTENHGDVLLHAYETPTPHYGDIGEGVISNGECIIFLDEILQECINTDLLYQVFTQVYHGSITNIKRYKEYFIVYGSNGTEFGWEVKGKRRGYEYERFTRFTELRRTGTPTEDTPEVDLNAKNYEVIE